MLHGYCVRRAGDPPPDTLVGLADAPVRLVEEGELGLWCGTLERKPHTDLRALQLHDRVIRAALGSATPIPLRFGAAFGDEAAARAMLRERADEFLEKLDRLGNRVEMGIRISRADGSDPAADAAGSPGEGASEAPPVRSGREYLEARRRALQAAERTRAEADRALDGVDAALRDLELLSHREPLPGGGALGLLAHLVQREEVTAYRERVRSLRDPLSDLRLVVSGPWAPYSFV